MTNRAVPGVGCLRRAQTLHCPAPLAAGFPLLSWRGVTENKFPALLALRRAEFVSDPVLWQLAREDCRREGAVPVFPVLSGWLAAQFGSSGFNPAWVQGQAREGRNAGSNFFPWDIINKNYF